MRSSGFIVAWTLVRYTIPGKKFIDAMIDLPFALPTAVSGIALTAVYAQNGWIGQYLEPLGIKAAFSPLGITIALMFIGLPFVVRTLQPAIEELDRETEEAAASLGATRWQTFWRVILPAVLPALLTGFALSFARALGEYGSVVFISGNMPMKTEIASLLIITKLEQYDYAGATAIATVMLAASFVMLLAINAAAMVERPQLSRCRMSAAANPSLGGITPEDVARRNRPGRPAAAWRPTSRVLVKAAADRHVAHVPDAGAVRAAGGDLRRSVPQRASASTSPASPIRTRCRRSG